MYEGECYPRHKKFIRDLYIYLDQIMDGMNFFLKSFVTTSTSIDDIVPKPQNKTKQKMDFFHDFISFP